MILLQLKNISKQFLGQPIFQHVQMEVKSQNRIAIVGRNGAGKSTLLKIITSELPYDEGEIFQTKDLEIGYLAQHNDLDSQRTIWNEMITVFSDLIKEEKALEEIAKTIEKISSTGELDEKMMLNYGQRQEKFADHGGYRYKSDIRGVLTGLGFSETDFDLCINDLSGGQKTRLALGKLLLRQPELLILDEPTNHLDIPTLTWLENFLMNYQGAIVIVSHDRYFLDKLVTIVYEISHKQATRYHGTYTQFLKQKEANYERDLKLYEKQQQEIKEMEEFIAKNIARASTTKRAQSRRKQLEKMTLLDKPLGNEAEASFSFEVTKSSGKDVIQVRELTYTHDNEQEPLFFPISFTIHRGERIALIGDNGVGKTTVLKLLMTSHSHIDVGANVQIGYYAQEQEKLQPSHTILEEVWNTFPDKKEQTIRTVLGNFLFSGDDVLKTIHNLSGGEKARVSLAKLMLEQANFLILDEPTNHLDLASKEILERALEQFEGTILFVSHDRYFINKLADKVFKLEKSGLKTYLGNYDYYLEKEAEEKEIKKLEGAQRGTTESSPKSKKKQHLSFQEQKRLERETRKLERNIEKIEQEIELLENELQNIENEMMSPENVQDHETLRDLSAHADNLREKIEAKMEKWAALQS